MDNQLNGILAILRPAAYKDVEPSGLDAAAALTRLLDASTDHLVGRLAARVEEWTTSPTEQRIVADLGRSAEFKRDQCP